MKFKIICHKKGVSQMMIKVSISGVDKKTRTSIQREINRLHEERIESMEDYARLMRMVRESFGKNSGL